MNNAKKPPLTKPAGCFVQFVGAIVIFYGLSQFIADPPKIFSGIVALAIGGVILLLGRKTR
jgi:hypothetical protein